MKHKPELLAPAGDFETLVTAITAGADAVYFGIKDFNMRARAKNFQLKDLQKIRKIAGKRVKLYLALNTIIYDNELKKAEKIIKRAKHYIDAIICSDISVIQLCKKYKIPFHISTQASVSNTETAMFYKKLGAERIVLARELNLKQIKKISKIIPIECFIHGAMCVSVSGRCFTSQFLFNQSANRGKCIQPCRRPYQVYKIKDNQKQELKISNHHVMSAKDLCALPFIDKLKKAGITSFKIEGRNREPEYVDTVVRVYKKALDKKSKQTPKEIKGGIEELNKVYTKGFSSGFYLGLPTSDDFSDVEHSKATQKKQFIGKISHYYKKIKVGQLKLNNGPLKLNDEIIILGNTTGIKRAKVKSMEIKNKQIKIAKKGQEIAVKLPLCRKGDELYRVIRRNK